ncbi:MAG TPA: recombination protein O N-terminal domain-containing protein, partial [Calditrichia bacterium]|nr:recombination protein O N-terminal domain-containing protein [Calditrichia bacterium]
MSEVLKTEALILGALRWRESSKIVHLYTRELGAVSVIAKGALRPKSPFRGALEALAAGGQLGARAAQAALRTRWQSGPSVGLHRSQCQSWR